MKSVLYLTNVAKAVCGNICGQFEDKKLEGIRSIIMEGFRNGFKMNNYGSRLIQKNVVCFRNRINLKDKIMEKNITYYSQFMQEVINSINAM